jgi:hypothetical protein
MTAPTPNGPRSFMTGRGGTWLMAGAVLAFAVLVGAAVYEEVGPEVPRSDAEPYIANFAQELRGEVHEPLPSDDQEKFEHGPNIGGCAIGYGLNGECVPYNFPPYVADTYEAKCSWLKAQGAGALEVPGDDRHGIVPSGAPISPLGNPYACPDVLHPAEGVAPS